MEGLIVPSDWLKEERGCGNAAMTQPDTDFVIIGGFLGAGKTTLITALSALLQEKGRRVGIITNDQASGLVDTRLAALTEL